MRRPKSDLGDFPDDPLLARVRRLLADSVYADNPLREPLAELLKSSDEQRQRLARLVKISDGYHLLSRDSKETLGQQYDRQLRRIEKLVKISDGYQLILRELSEALKEASLHDPLTNLGNRRFLMERLNEESLRANRTGDIYSLCIADIDFFKSINDRFGHDVGDKALCGVASVIREAIREYDICGRWGGEEFLLILPDTLKETAIQVAERVRGNMAEMRFARIDGSISISLGVTCYICGENSSDTLKRADIALWRAKEGRRNRVEFC